MKLNSNHVTYQQADVACSQPQLVLILCDAAIRYVREAADHLTAGRWAEKGKSVDAAFECLSQLRLSLDHQNGGEIVENIDRMYDLLSTKLTLGNASRDPNQFNQVVKSLQTLRDAWSELFDRLRIEGKLHEASQMEATLAR